MEIGDYKLYVAYIYQKLTHKHGFIKYTLKNSSRVNVFQPSKVFLRTGASTCIEIGLGLGLASLSYIFTQ